MLLNLPEDERDAFLSNLTPAMRKFLSFSPKGYRVINTKKLSKFLNGLDLSTDPGVALLQLGDSFDPRVIGIDIPSEVKDRIDFNDFTYSVQFRGKDIYSFMSKSARAPNKRKIEPAGLRFSIEETLKCADKVCVDEITPTMKHKSDMVKDIVRKYTPMRPGFNNLTAKQIPCPLTSMWLQLPIKGSYHKDQRRENTFTGIFSGTTEHAIYKALLWINGTYNLMKGYHQKELSLEEVEDSINQLSINCFINIAKSLPYGQSFAPFSNVEPFTWSEEEINAYKEHFVARSLFFLQRTYEDGPIHANSNYSKGVGASVYPDGTISSKKQRGYCHKDYVPLDVLIDASDDVLYTSRPLKEGYTSSELGYENYEKSLKFYTNRWFRVFKNREVSDTEESYESCEERILDGTLRCVSQGLRRNNIDTPYWKKNPCLYRFTIQYWKEFITNQDHQFSIYEDTFKSLFKDVTSKEEHVFTYSNDFYCDLLRAHSRDKNSMQLFANLVKDFVEVLWNMEVKPRNFSILNEDKVYSGTYNERKLRTLACKKIDNLALGSKDKLIRLLSSYDLALLKAYPFTRARNVCGIPSVSTANGYGHLSKAFFMAMEHSKYGIPSTNELVKERFERVFGDQELQGKYDFYVLSGDGTNNEVRCSKQLAQVLRMQPDAAAILTSACGDVIVPGMDGPYAVSDENNVLLTSGSEDTSGSNHKDMRTEVETKVLPLIYNKTNIKDIAQAIKKTSDMFIHDEDYVLLYNILYFPFFNTDDTADIIGLPKGTNVSLINDKLVKLKDYGLNIQLVKTSDSFGVFMNPSHNIIRENLSSKLVSKADFNEHTTRGNEACLLRLILQELAPNWFVESISLTESKLGLELKSLLEAGACEEIAYRIKHSKQAYFDEVYDPKDELIQDIITTTVDKVKKCSIEGKNIDVLSVLQEVIYVMKNKKSSKQKGTKMKVVPIDPSQYSRGVEIRDEDILGFPCYGDDWDARCRIVEQKFFASLEEHVPVNLSSGAIRSDPLSGHDLT